MSARRFRPNLRRLYVAGVLLAVACRSPAYLPVATLQRVAPACGANPVAPRPGDRGPTYFSCQVDQASEPPADRVLKYPVIFADAGVEGEVLLQFVVSERGVVDSTTIKTVRSTHELFVPAARESILGWRGRPAKRGARAVRQLTTHAFCFKIPATGAIARCSEDLARTAPRMSTACAASAATTCSSHGGCQPVAPRRPPDVPCK